MLHCIQRDQNVFNQGFVPKSRVKTRSAALDQCVGYQYMLLECPTKRGFEVFCFNNLTAATAPGKLSAGIIEDIECEGTPIPDAWYGPINAGSNGHCVGPYGDPILQGWFGGWNRGAVYKVAGVSNPSAGVRSATLDLTAVVSNTIIAPAATRTFLEQLSQRVRSLNCESGWEGVNWYVDPLLVLRPSRPRFSSHRRCFFTPFGCTLPPHTAVHSPIAAHLRQRSAANSRCVHPPPCARCSPASQGSTDRTNPSSSPPPVPEHRLFDRAVRVPRCAPRWSAREPAVENASDRELRPRFGAALCVWRARTCAPSTILQP